MVHPPPITLSLVKTCFMRKTVSIVLGGVALITLLAQYGSLASISTNRYTEYVPADSQQVAMGCAPLPQTVNESSAANGDFRVSAFLSDEELSKFKYESMIFELAPGQSDTISHRHDCDVFVTVLEGTLLLGQEFAKPDTVKTGEIFHEKRNIIHSVSINPSKEQRMKALVVFIRKDGRASYTPLYPKK